MDHIELKKCVEAYEAGHAVDEYIINGWHVWPLLKIAAWWGWFVPTPDPAPETGGRFIRFIRLQKSRIYRLYRWVAGSELRGHAEEERAASDCDKEQSDPYDAQRDVVILTLSQRRVLMDGTLYEIYSDPLVEQLHKMGKSTLVWELGEERYPRHSKSAWISRRMADECSRLLLSSHPQEASQPIWFEDYQKFALELTGRVVVWSEIGSRIDVVYRQSIIFEQWLRRTGARYLFVVNWYNPQVMAAIMAAKRCGIKTIDVQHGVGGAHDFSYVSWTRMPLNGYELMPDVFWRWGKISADEIRQYNPAFSTHPTAVAGGNLWLNRWRSNVRIAETPEDDAKLSAHKKTILVSLQLDIEPLLLDAIKASPPSWVWLIRSHPRKTRAERDQEAAILKSTGHPGIELERANSLLLYELLCVSDVHVTGDSACALEALAFGVASITISDLGRETFAKMIELGVIAFSKTSSELIAMIEHAQRINSEKVPTIADMFASDEDAREALRIIMGVES